MADAAAARSAAALQAAVSRSTLQDAVKQTSMKDLAAWASLIRYDAILAAAAGAGGEASLTAWRGVDRLAGQAYLANKDAVKAAPVPYISLTLDQARANM
jgi:hypothetical protein